MMHALRGGIGPRLELSSLGKQYDYAKIRSDRIVGQER
jgi:hypothetical protein